LREQQAGPHRTVIVPAGLSKQDYPLPAGRQQSTICCASLKKIL
jgi:hypothetical protein